MKKFFTLHQAYIFRWISLLIAGLFITIPVFSQQSSRKLVPKGTNGTPFGYFEYLPAAYASKSEKQPLILYLHGAGELGNGSSDLNKLKQRALPKLLQNGKEIPFVVIAPQSPLWWHRQNLLPMLEWIKQKYNIDPARIYITGISMGGTKAWRFAGDHPDKVAAVLPMGADARNMDACRLSSVPVWAFHGATDHAYPVSAMKAAIHKLNTQCNPRANPAAKSTVYSDHGHDDLWTHVYDVRHGDDIYRWMLQHKKSSTSPTNRPPVAKAGADIRIKLPQNSVSIKGAGTDPDGSIRSYQWKKISGPSASLRGTNASTLKASNLLAGTYDFELTVTDNKGATGKDRMKVVVAKPAKAGDQAVAQGLNYKYYHGSWNMLPPFERMQPRKTGKVKNFSLSPRSRSNLFGFEFTGYIKIATSGTYTFYTESDDGSKLYLNNKQLVNNDGLHGMKEASGSIYLKAGSHPIKVTYFERYGSREGLRVSYSGPGISKRIIPDAVLSTGSSAISEAVASKPAADGNYRVLINFNRGRNGAAPWNNANAAPNEGVKLQNFKNDKGASVPLKLMLETPWGSNDGKFHGYNDYGKTTGNNSGIFPDAVIKTAWWTERTEAEVIRISGLNNTGTYTFTLFGSRDGSGDRSTIYSIGNKSGSLNASGNTSKSVTITGVKANSNGEVLLTVQKGAKASFGYLNAMVITYSSGSATKATAAMATASDSHTDDLEEELATNDLKQLQLLANPVKNDRLLLAAAAERGIQEGAVEIYDTSGRRHRATLKQSTAVDTWEVDVSHLHRGIYILLLEQADGQLQRIRFIQQ